MAIKASDIPPIRGNKRIGREAPGEASVVWGGAKPPEKPPGKKRKQPAPSTPARPTPARSKKSGRRRKQQNFAIRNEATLRELSEKLGITASAVVNLGIALLAREYL